MICTCMLSDRFEKAYIPEIIPEDDLQHFDKGGYGKKIGWGTTPALLVVDMTEEFVNERTEEAKRAVNGIEQLLKVVRDTGLPIFYTRPNRSYPPEYRGTTKPKAKSTDTDRSAENTILERLSPSKTDVVINKPRASAFFDTHLANMLHYYDVDTLIVTGMTTSGCVRATVVDSHSSNFRTIVPRECTADRSKISHQASLFDLDMKYADVDPLDEVVSNIYDIG